MSANESGSVYSSLEVLHWILRLFGYAPFRMKQPRKSGSARDLRASGWCTKLYSLCFAALYALVYGAFMSNLNHNGFSASIIEGKGERVYFTLNFVTTIYGIVNAYIVRDKIEKMLHKLHTVDRKTSRWKRTVDHEQLRSQIWHGVYLVAVTMTTYIYGTVITCQMHTGCNAIQLLHVLIYTLFVNSYALMMLQCTTLLETIRARYKLLNSCFRVVNTAKPSERLSCFVSYRFSFIPIVTR
uniref:Gustatory receptor n=1 Tax=Anopheles farauti TaxID=69004 RepID=A0A182QFB5_9DIPT